MDKELILNYYVPLGLPIPFKKWHVFPITVKDSYFWKKTFDILMVDKNSINNIEIIQMSYLKYLVVEGLKDETVLGKLNNILSLCLHLQNYTLDIELEEKTNEVVLLIVPNVEVNSGKILPNYSEAKKITAQEFDELKKIILYQNIYGYDDKYIDPDVKKVINRYYSVVNRNTPIVTLEKRIAVVMASTGMTLEQINNMTFRSFNLVFDTIVDKVDYTILRQAELSPDIEFKKPIEHWVFKEEHDKYKDAFVDYDQVASKINSTNI